MLIGPPINLHKWIADNTELLEPPVNAFCLYSGYDFIVMAVGGPNERADYHINETEEWFYQYKGSMLLRVVVDDVFADVPIQEGEMFLLPANTPHNPVRFADTTGIVIERRRSPESIDRLRWYCREETTSCGQKPTIIREDAFHVTDLGTQLGAFIGNWIENEPVRKCPACGTVAKPM